MAPAGSFDAMKAAIAGGADAVYFGGEKFGARHFADNLKDVQIQDAVEYAHVRGVKVYITINTLIHDSELLEIGKFVHFLYSIGVDALLVQDPGVISYIQYLFSDLKDSPDIHASTQLSVHNSESAIYACRLGCKRIVLARELSKSDILDIAHAIKKYNGEIEIFIHGALCYAYSGQCLLSSVIGGRSGNRGMCAQPCRKPYSLFVGNHDFYGRFIPIQLSSSEQYLMSTKDLSVYPKLSEISALPVTSLKIEGRMRNPSYVGLVTQIYRKSLNSIQDGSFIPSKEDSTVLSLAFSRGFSTGYLNGETYQTVMSRMHPGRQGLFIGTIIRKISYNTVVLNFVGEILPENGDGMVCIGIQNEQGFIIRNNPVLINNTIQLEIPFKCSKGDKIFLTNRASLSKAIHLTIMNQEKNPQTIIQLQIQVTIDQTGDVHISGTAVQRDGRTFSDEFQLEQSFSKARTYPVPKEQIEKLFEKTGGTLFSLKITEIVCPDDIFAPISVINAMRREILTHYTRRIIDSYKPSQQGNKQVSDRVKIFLDNNHEKSEDIAYFGDLEIVVLVSDIEGIIAASKAGAHRIYIELYPGSPDDDASETSLSEFLSLLNTDTDLKNRIGIKIPKIIRRKELDHLYKRVPDIIASGLTHILVDGIGIAESLWEYSDLFTISGYTGLNITNSLSFRVFQDYNFLTLSVELSGREIFEIMHNKKKCGNPSDVAIMGQGIIESMITEDHLYDSDRKRKKDEDYFGLKDSKGQIFPIFTDPAGRTHIFNSIETSLIEYLPAIRDAGINKIILDARWRGSEYPSMITKIWKDALALSQSSWNQDIVQELKEKIKKISYNGITSATWKRGLS